MRMKVEGVWSMTEEAETYISFVWGSPVSFEASRWCFPGCCVVVVVVVSRVVWTSSQTQPTSKHMSLQISSTKRSLVFGQLWVCRRIGRASCTGKQARAIRCSSTSHRRTRTPPEQPRVRWQTDWQNRSRSPTPTSFAGGRANDNRAVAAQRFHPATLAPASIASRRRRHRATGNLSRSHPRSEPRPTHGMSCLVTVWKTFHSHLSTQGCLAQSHGQFDRWARHTQATPTLRSAGLCSELSIWSPSHLTTHRRINSILNRSVTSDYANSQTALWHNDICFLFGLLEKIHNKSPTFFKIWHSYLQIPPLKINHLWL